MDLRLLPATALALLLLTPAYGVAAEGQTFRRACRFTVARDGEPLAASRVYQRTGAPDLVAAPGDGTWLYVRPATRRFQPLNPASVQDADERTVTVVPPPASRGRSLTYDLAAGALLLGEEGGLAVIPTPDLLGETTAEAFLGLCPELQDRELAYEPDPGAVGELAACTRPITVEIYFGSWCPHCQQVLPRLLRALRDADNDHLDVRLYALPRKLEASGGRGVRKVPTIVLLEGGVEIGRFHGLEEVPVEETLADLVRHTAPAPSTDVSPE
ncbi:MAG: thioredoxin family protein [Acidobacteriota bacterium]